MMIHYSSNEQRWTISNTSATYIVGLRDNKCHHLGYIPNAFTEQMEEWIKPQKEFQPESEVHVNYGSRVHHHGARWLGCNASSRAEYQSHTIEELEESQILTITSLDSVSGLVINNHYTIYTNSPALVRSVTLRNIANLPIDIQHLGSFSIYGMPFFTAEPPGKEIIIHSFPTSWCWEGQTQSMTAEEAGLFHKNSLGSWHIESTGSWSSKEYMPFFVIEQKALGIFWCVQIEHSGSWRFEISGTGVSENGLYMQGGLGNYANAHWMKRLLPGEEFSSPKISLACTQGTIDNAFNAMHQHRAQVLIQRSINDRSFPVIFNEWISTEGKVREETVHAHLDALDGLGVEVYAIDAGWYFPFVKEIDCSLWYLYAGDWEPDAGRFPSGITKTVERIKQKGMIAGIWLEIEVAGTESRAYYDYEQLFMKTDYGVLEDNTRRFLYFGYAETRAYATAVVEKLIKAGFGYFKIDYNNDLGLGCMNAGISLGHGLVEHVRGYYGWLDSMRNKYPEVIFENCSSGGNRLDYGMLARSDLASITDQADWFRLSRVFYGVSKYIHPSQMGNWSVVKPDISVKELVFRLTNSMLGRMHLSGLIEQLASEMKEIVAQAIQFYKKWRDILNDVSVYHHTEDVSLQQLDGWLILQMNNATNTKLCVGAWRLADKQNCRTVKITGIDPSKLYKVTSFPESVEKIISGKLWADQFSIELESEFSSVIYGIEQIRKADEV
ncbi:alpha-galactosidase [Paenibacillus psychroresistens]|uniref:Alpha-galactosidase n=1 Tax=Paenibacillus psychroresistens TaxID=1778678 RepID=A0A6B8RTG9_9BACL|nr:alpha-galactosidase [Paenibacillus psychroresistens]QGQ98508.1 alpha-galactosidase [Paenibacillus psychroresistens]